jgi:hypothetical protein
VDADRGVAALDLDQSAFTEDRGSGNQPCGGLAERHATRRRDRLHPLPHADLLAHRRVGVRPGPDIACDDSPGVEPDAKPQ